MWSTICIIKYQSVLHSVSNSVDMIFKVILINKPTGVKELL